MHPTIEEKVKNILIETLFIDPTLIHLTSDLEKDLKVDELDLINVALFLEDEFNIEIPDETIEQFKTVKDLMKCVEQKLLCKGENNGRHETEV